MTDTVYCFDTSAWVHAWVRVYPPENFPGVWDEIDNLIETERLISPEEVREELGRRDDDLAKWLKDRSDVFRPVTVEQQQEVRSLLVDYPRLVDSSKGRNEADPWVIVLAEQEAATVVTQEAAKPTNPKIPDICRDRSTPFCRVLDVVTDEGWSFVSAS